MNSELDSRRVVNLTKAGRSGNSIHLKFTLPKGIHVNSSLSVDVHLNTDFEEKNNTILSTGSTPLKVIELNAASEETIRQIEVQNVIAKEILPVEVKPREMLSSIEINIQDDENQIYPYNGLRLKNSQAVYKTGMSYVRDINQGKKHFGFAAMSSKLNELHLLVYGSFINYSTKKPVLVIVKDLNDKAFDEFRSNFSTGTLCGWLTKDWGSLCIVDYKQLNKKSDSFKPSDLRFITDEFDCVLWSLPATNLQGEFQKMSLEVLNRIDSITYVIQPGETKNKELNKSAEYYQCFDIAVKGILVGEGLK